MLIVKINDMPENAVESTFGMEIDKPTLPPKTAHALPVSAALS